MRTDETLRLRLATADRSNITAPSLAHMFARLQAAETRANVEYARWQVERERREQAEANFRGCDRDDV